MSKFLGSPKLLAALAVVVVIFIVSVAGGALGNEFGGGFLGSPIAHIQLPAESITADALFLDFKITNTMIATWLTILVLAAVAFLVGRRIGEVPSRLQSLLEVVFEFFLNLTESVAGREKGRRFFPLVMTIFLFIVTANWLGILPGFSTIGRVETAEEIVHHAVEEVEKENKKDSEKAPKEVDLSEINLQVFDGDGAVGIIPFGSMDGQITALGLYELKTVVEELTDPQRQILLADAQKIQKSADVGHKIAVERETPDLVAGKLDGKPVLDPGELDGKRPGILVPFLRGANTDVNTTLAIALIAMFMVHFWALRALGLWGHLSKFINLREGPIGFFVGVLEGISEVARIISFTFRLFGNIFAGEVLLVALAFLLPLIGIIPFLGLELFVGLIQAFIFSMLTLLFAAMATVGHGAEQH